MTVSSLVQQGHQNQGYLDSGPYSADQWAAFYSAFRTTQPSAAGIRANYLNEFEGSNPSGANIQIETGAAMVNGRPILNDSSLTFAVSSPAANPRIDVLVLCLNNTAVARTAGIASGNNMLFPTDLTDYDGAAEIPPFTVRPVILTGTEAASPTAPTLDSDPSTLFMVPVASYEISTGGAISNFTDLRRYDSVSPSTLIAKYEVENGNRGQVDIDLPQIFRQLRLVFRLKAATGTDIYLGIRLNDEATSGHYRGNYVQGVDTTISGGTDGTSLFSIPTAGDRGYFVSGELLFHSYTKTRDYHFITGNYYVAYEPVSIATSAVFNYGAIYVPAVAEALTKLNLLITGTGGGSGPYDSVEIALYGLN